MDKQDRRGLLKVCLSQGGKVSLGPAAVLCHKFLFFVNKYKKTLIMYGLVQSVTLYLDVCALLYVYVLAKDVGPPTEGHSVVKLLLFLFFDVMRCLGDRPIVMFVTLRSFLLGFYFVVVTLGAVPSSFCNCYKCKCKLLLLLLTCISLVCTVLLLLLLLFS